MANHSRISMSLAGACLSLAPALAQGWPGEACGTEALPIVRHAEEAAGAGNRNAAVCQPPELLNPFPPKLLNPTVVVESAGVIGGRA